jgi:hypothetical protein
MAMPRALAVAGMAMQEGGSSSRWTFLEQQQQQVIPSTPPAAGNHGYNISSKSIAAFA